MTSEIGQLECGPGTGEGLLGARFHQGYAVQPGKRSLRSRKKGGPCGAMRYWVRKVRARFGVKGSLRPVYCWGRTALGPKYVELRRPERPVVIHFYSTSLPTVLLRGSAHSRVHVVAPLPPVLVARRAPSIPSGASLGLRPRLARTVRISTPPQYILLISEGAR